ncbi:hypothetical protein ACFV1L_17615 [Kitasatospora sp. NPDC059646]|uniref:hypothetical protein n=1 Tax=Kitasatospora sp. NPDC059646 TaxID=3346893 RepID=UPI0036A39B79
MTTHSGRIAEHTDPAPDDLHTLGVGRTDLFPAEPHAADHYRTERQRSEEYRLDEELAARQAAPDTGPGTEVETAGWPDADDPGWDYEDVILRSVN